MASKVVADLGISPIGDHLRLWSDGYSLAPGCIPIWSALSNEIVRLGDPCKIVTLPGLPLDCRLNAWTGSRYRYQIDYIMRGDHLSIGRTCRGVHRHTRHLHLVYTSPPSCCEKETQLRACSRLFDPEQCFFFH